MVVTEIKNRILIVEDDVGVRSLMTRHFRRKGFEVEQAGDAEEVLLRFGQAEQTFDVVLTDVHLPGQSGVDLGRQIHQINPTQPIVYMTGDSDSGIAREALRDGAAGFLLKPFEFFELDTVVKHAVQRAPAPLQRFQGVAQGLGMVSHVATPAKVVLAPVRPRPSQFAARTRVALATAAAIVLAWLAGNVLMPSPSRTPAAPQPAAVVAPSPAPIMVPVVVGEK
jgi:FixJ family two-component response regulator